MIVPEIRKRHLFRIYRQAGQGVDGLSQTVDSLVPAQSAQTDSTVAEHNGLAVLNDDVCLSGFDKAQAAGTAGGPAQ